MSKNIFVSLFLLLCSLFLLLILLSYDITDPSLHVASSTTVHNLGNKIGAYIADIIFQYLGFSGFLLTILPCIPLFYKRLRCLKAIIFLFSSISLSLLLTLVNREYGGMVGIILVSYLLQYFTFTTLLSITLSIVTLLLFSVCSPISLIKRSIKHFFKSLDNKSKSSFNTIATPRFTLPSISLLTKNNNSFKKNVQDSSPDTSKQLLEQALEDFDIHGKVTRITIGPVVTLYKLQTTAKVRRVIGLADDIAKFVQVPAIRIIQTATQNVLDIELPNLQRKIVFLREILESQAYKKQAYPLPIVLGKDTKGNGVILNLVKAPHMLLVGSTGSGKSMTLKVIIMSLIYCFSPQECMFIVMSTHALRVYNDLPHLLYPIVTTETEALTTLEEIVKEMEKRYRAMNDVVVNSIAVYNKKVLLHTEKELEKTMQVAFDDKTGKPIFRKKVLHMQLMPYIILIIDEIEPLLVTDYKKSTAAIQKLTQMAHKVGIHLIIATQRLSILTEEIKTNFTTKISFVVTSKIDSHAVLKEQGAEQLLGMGDMLYMHTGGKIKRVHGAFIHNDELQKVMKYLTAQR